MVSSKVFFSTFSFTHILTFTQVLTFTHVLTFLLTYWRGRNSQREWEDEASLCPALRCSRRICLQFIYVLYNTYICIYVFVLVFVSNSCLYLSAGRQVLQFVFCICFPLKSVFVCGEELFPNVWDWQYQQGCCLSKYSQFHNITISQYHNITISQY